jgi:hypothetical protein
MTTGESIVECPQCGAESPPGNTFCGKCGSGLELSAPDSEIATVETARSEGYRLPGAADLAAADKPGAIDRAVTFGDRRLVACVER